MSRAKYLERTYGITEKQWDTLYTLQEGLCPICQNAIHRPGNKLGRRAAAVDHDHKTGRVRGLTCHVCNRQRIGMNTVATAERLLAYLQNDIDGRIIKEIE